LTEFTAIDHCRVHVVVPLHVSLLYALGLGDALCAYGK
jgi:hypothetical protein